MRTVMKIFLLIAILLLVGCSALKENQNSTKVVQNEDKKSELKVKTDNTNSDLISNDRKKCYDIWQTCNNEFYAFIGFLKDKNYNEAKYLITENIVIDKDEIINHAYIKGEKFKLGNFYFGKQRHYNISNNDTVFDTGYEVIYNDDGSIYVCYVKFVKAGDRWRIDFIDIDIG
jgi:protein involved in sex pheromone biosynthesis